jgi:hypothetical protein
LIWQNNFTFRGLCLHKPQGKMSVKGRKKSTKNKEFSFHFFLEKKVEQKFKAHEK